jgi:hypothetical protein
MNNLEQNQSFNLEDLMSQINLNDYKGVVPELDNKIKDLQLKRKEELKQKLRAKTNNLRNNRMSKEIRENNQINSLKENPMFQNINNVEDTKKIIETMASSMSKDSKQKKNIKKQIEKLVDKMKTPEIVL